MVLLCISIITNYVIHFSQFAFAMSSLHKQQFKFFVHFLIQIFYCWVVGDFYTFLVICPSQIHDHIRYMKKVAFTLFRLSFHSLDDVIWYTKQVLVKSDLPSFFFFAHVFDIISKNPLSTPRTQQYPPMTFGIIVKSLINFELIF